MINGLSEANASPSAATDVAAPAPSQATEHQPPVVHTSDASVSNQLGEKPAKMFNQDQVNVISNNAKKAGEKEAAEKFRAQYDALYAPKTALQQQEGGQKSEAVQSMPQDAKTPLNASNAVLDQETKERLYTEFRERERQEYLAEQRQQITDNFLLKLQTEGKGNLLKKSGLGEVPSWHPVVPMLGLMDNATDIVNDFAENPEKLTSLLNVTALNPDNGFEAIQKISAGLKANKEALAKEKAPPPINQLKSTSYGLGGGEKTISDKRKDKRFFF